MAGGTRAVQVLDAAGARFTLHEYDVAEGDKSYGEAVASSLGVDPRRLFKTLVATVDGRPVVGVVPVSRRLSLKKLARVAGGKHAEMADPADAKRLTGYVVGGISPFGQRRRLPMYLDTSATDYDTVLVSAGRRGLQVEVAPGDLIACTGAGRRRTGRVTRRRSRYASVKSIRLSEDDVVITFENGHTGHSQTVPFRSQAGDIAAVRGEEKAPVSSRILIEIRPRTRRIDAASISW